MQTAVQVMCTKGESLRRRIADHSHKHEAYELAVVAEKAHGRDPGWMKIRSKNSGRRGALNISWHPGTNTLTCRVVNKATGKPNLIIGDFVDFLLCHYSRRIKFINVFRV